MLSIVVWQFLLQQHSFFDLLRVEWEENKWVINKHIYLTLAIDCLPEELNPYNFSLCEAAYLDKLQNYYIKHNE